MKKDLNSITLRIKAIFFLTLFTGLLVINPAIAENSAQTDTKDTAAAEPVKLIRIAAMGDIMLGTEGWLPDDGGKGSFKAVIKYLDGADIIFGNQEGTLSDTGECVKSGENPYCFKTPTSYTRFYKEAGFNMLSIANNHINDFGPEAKKQTMAALKENGIAFSGPPGTVAEVDVDGTKVGMIAFYTGRGSHQMNNIPEARAIVKKAAKKYDILIVSFHGGAEGRNATHVKTGGETFMGENRGDVIKFSRAMIDAGADMVLGHGPHVPRAMEVYKDRLIAYSLGNFCTGKRISVKGVSGYAPLLLADVSLNGELVGGKVVSFIQEFGQHPKVDKKNRAASLIHELGREDLPKTTAVAKDGSLIPPKKK